MSYARMGKDSDVYVLGLIMVDGYTCMACKLTEEREVFNEGLNRTFRVRGDTTVDTPQDMIAHLKEHMDAGHKVPKDAIKRLKEDASYF